MLAAVPARRLTRAVGPLAPGSEVELRYVRDGRERVVRVRTIAPADGADAGPAVREFRRVVPGTPGTPGEGPRVEFFTPPGPGRDPAGAARLGRGRATFDSLRARAAERPVLGVTVGGTGSARDTLGLFVSAVATGGPAERAGVVEGDRIATINDVDLRVPREERDAPEASAARRARFTREIERLRAGDRVTLRLWGDGRWRSVTATVARAGDVYRNAPGAIGFRMIGPEGTGALGDGAFGEGAFDMLRMAPPSAMGPEFRSERFGPPGMVPGVAMPRVRMLRAPRAPLPPLPPRPARAPRGPGRIVTI
jgi:hypothetical protein